MFVCVEVNNEDDEDEIKCVLEKEATRQSWKHKVIMVVIR